MRRWTRLWRHAALDARDSRRALPAAAAERLALAVADSESRHSGEIRICVEGGLPWPLLWPVRSDAGMALCLRQRAREWFGRLGVWDTEQRNGVLIYLLLAERSIEIVADRGLDAHVSASEWQALVAALGKACARGEYEAGLHAVLQAVGQLLERHYPLPPGQRNPNELPDAVVCC